MVEVSQRIIIFAPLNLNTSKLKIQRYKNLWRRTFWEMWRSVYLFILPSYSYRDTGNSGTTLHIYACNHLWSTKSSQSM